MPVVPQITAPSVSPSSTTGIPFQGSNAATPDAFGAGVAQAGQQLASSIDNLGGVFAKHAMEMQDKVNRADANAALVNWDIDQSKLMTDFTSKEGRAAIEAQPKFIQDQRDLFSKYKDQITNPATKLLFDNDAKRQIGYSIKESARYTAAQTKAYSNSTSAAKVQLGIDQAASTKDDEHFIGTVGLVSEAVKQSDKWQYASPEEREVMEKSATSSVWQARISSMANTDPTRALKILKENWKEFDGLKVHQIFDTVNQKLIQKNSGVEAERLVNSTVGVDDGLMGEVKKLEGFRTNAYPDGKQTSIGYGTKAHHPGEVIDEKTGETRLRYELSRAANSVDAAYPNLPEGTRKALISLTYNVGSEWMNAGLGAAMRAGDNAKAKEIFAQYKNSGGQENPGLVSRRNQELSWWGGEKIDRSQTTESRTAMLAERAQEIAQKQYPDDPVLQQQYSEAIRNKAATTVTMQKRAATEINVAQKLTVQKELFVPNNPPTSYEMLSPIAKEAYDNSDPAVKASYMRQFKINALAPPVFDPVKSAARRDELSGMAILHPEEFRSVNLANEEFLGAADKAQFAKKQASVEKLIQDGAHIRKYLQMPSVQSQLNDAQVGLSKSDVGPGSKNEKMFKFTGAFLTEANAMMDARGGKGLSDDEASKITAKLLRKQVLDPGIPFVPFTGKEANAFELYNVSQADAMKLPPGTKFHGTDGKEYTR